MGNMRIFVRIILNCKNLARSLIVAGAKNALKLKIMKMGFRYFRDQILKMLGIDYDYVDIGPTELVELTIHSMFMDFTFLTTEDFYIHVEFQTTDSGEDDLRRFHAYEAVFSHETGKQVLTYVIYSGGIKNARDTLDCGAYQYHVFRYF